MVTFLIKNLSWSSKIICFLLLRDFFYQVRLIFMRVVTTYRREKFLVFLKPFSFNFSILAKSSLNDSLRVYFMRSFKSFVMSQELFLSVLLTEKSVNKAVNSFSDPILSKKSYINSSIKSSWSMIKLKSLDKASSWEKVLIILWLNLSMVLIWKKL